MAGATEISSGKSQPSTPSAGASEGRFRTSTFIVRDNLKGEDPRVQRSFERIERSVIRCDRIIDELLDFTRISDFEPEPTAIDTWLDETLSEQTLPTKVELNRDFGLSGAVLQFDRDRLRRAVINVFDNACQAMAGEDGMLRTGARNPVLTVTTSVIRPNR